MNRSNSWGGQLIVSEPEGSAHYTAVLLAEEALRAALGAGWLVRTQGPIALDDESEPEPDIAAVPGRARDYSRAHPVRPALVVEVAETSLAHDRAYKGSLYALDRVLEVYRQPIRMRRRRSAGATPRSRCSIHRRPSRPWPWRARAFSGGVSRPGSPAPPFSLRAPPAANPPPPAAGL